MPTSLYGGYVNQPGRWHSGVKLGGVNTPPIEFVIDDTLPALGQDQQYPNRDWIVIPRGRIVAPKPTTLTRLFGTTVVTLANGVDPKLTPSGLNGTVPFGYAAYNLYRNFSGIPADKPLGVMHETIEVPYTTINEAYNLSTNGGTRLMVGEWLMPYYGINNGSGVVPKDTGKLVRWVEKKIYQDTLTTASGIAKLASAPFPAFLPRILMAWTADGTVVASGATLTYNNGDGKWWASFASVVSKVLYEYGASAAQKVGQCLGIEPVSTAGGVNATSHDIAGWLKWVTDNFSHWDWPPIMNVTPQTSVTDENVTLSSNSGTLANNPVVPYKPVTVSVTGTITNPDGTTTTIAGAMSLADSLFFNDQTQGQYYDIDFLTGVITFASNVSATSVKVSYYYETKFRDGLKYDAGILGLTDGRDSGITGLPPHLDIAGVMGALRVAILP